MRFCRGKTADQNRGSTALCQHWRCRKRGCKIILKEHLIPSMWLGEAGQFATHLSTQWNMARFASDRCLDCVFFTAFPASFCTHGTFLFSALQFSWKMTLQILLMGWSLDGTLAWVWMIFLSIVTGDKKPCKFAKQSELALLLIAS